MPAYLEANAGMDFTIDVARPPIASGGGGTVVYAKFLNFGIGAKYVRSGNVDFALKEVKDIGVNVFNQEVALMHYFKDQPSIIKLLAYNSSEMHIAMPLFELGPLSRVLADTSVNWTFDVVLQLACDVFEAQRVVHEASVVHCDIKSQNYLVKQDAGKYCAVLTDFGVCRVLSSANVVAGLQVNFVRGKSIAYSGPELFSTSVIPLQADAEKKRDVYAGSVVLNELVTRQMAWKYPQVFTTDEVTRMVLTG